jgi:hypothetical protein
MHLAPNKPAAPNAGIASRLTIGHQWPGVGEPERSAKPQLSIMKQIISLPVLVCAALLSGCAGPYHRASGEQTPGAVAIEVTTLLGYEGSLSAARLYVGGRFVGNYEPEKTVLHLPAGWHTVRLEVPSVYGRFNDNGSTVVREFALKGEERIEVLGGDSKQNLVFNGDNLKAKEIKHKDED